MDKTLAKQEFGRSDSEIGYAPVRRSSRRRECNGIEHRG